jgi:outer membrane protein assembly factor BamB
MRPQKPKLFLLLTALFCLICFSTKADGTNEVRELWRLKLPGGGSESSCAIAPDGTIYQGTFRGWLLAVTPDGKVKWKFKAGLEIKSSPAVADDGTIYFGSRDRKFYALTPDGKLKWSFPTGAWVDSSPAVATDGTVYFGSWDNTFYALTTNGKLKWQFATSNLITASPAIAADGTIYFGSHDKIFYALAPDGKPKWRFSTGAEIDGSPAIGADGAIYFGSTDGNLYALRSDGSELWHLHTGGYTAASPALDADGNLYLAANSDQVAVSRDGKLLWHHPTEVPMDMAWAVAANGMVYVSMPWLAISAMDGKNPWPPAWYFQMSLNLASAPNVDAQGAIYACDGSSLFALKLIHPAPLAKSSWPMWRSNPQHNGRVQKVN